jgi:hypothetical protein
MRYLRISENPTEKQLEAHYKIYNPELPCPYITVRAVLLLFVRNGFFVERPEIVVGQYGIHALEVDGCPFGSVGYDLDLVSEAEADRTGDYEQSGSIRVTMHPTEYSTLSVIYYDKNNELVREDLNVRDDVSEDLPSGKISELVDIFKNHVLTDGRIIVHINEYTELGDSSSNSVHAYGYVVGTSDDSTYKLGGLILVNRKVKKDSNRLTEKENNCFLIKGKHILAQIK